MTGLQWAMAACLGVGLLFNALGVVGILRFPDVYTRLHADTKATTFGSIFVGASVVLYALSAYASSSESGDPAGQHLTLAIHTVIAVVVLAFTNATGAHAIARAAHRSGVRPAPSITDKLGENEEEA